MLNGILIAVLVTILILMQIRSARLERERGMRLERTINERLAQVKPPHLVVYHGGKDIIEKSGEE